MTVITPSGDLTQEVRDVLEKEEQKRVQLEQVAEHSRMNIPLLHRKLMSGWANDHQAAIRVLHAHVARSPAKRVQLAAAQGVIPRLVKFLSSDKLLVAKAARKVSASQTTAHIEWRQAFTGEVLRHTLLEAEARALVVQAGVVRKLLELACSENTKGRGQAMRALAALSQDHHQAIIAAGGGSMIVKALQLATTRVKPENYDDRDVLESDQGIIQSSAAIALRYVASSSPECVAAIASAGGVAPLVHLLSSSTPLVQGLAVEALWHFTDMVVNDKDGLVPAVVHHGIIPPLLQLASDSDRKDIQVNAVGVVARLAKAGTCDCCGKPCGPETVADDCSNAAGACSKAAAMTARCRAALRAAGAVDILLPLCSSENTSNTTLRAWAYTGLAALLEGPLDGLPVLLIEAPDDDTGAEHQAGPGGLQRQASAEEPSEEAGSWASEGTSFFFPGRVRLRARRRHAGAGAVRTAAALEGLAPACGGDAGNGDAEEPKGQGHKGEVEEEDALWDLRQLVVQMYGSCDL